MRCTFRSIFALGSFLGLLIFVLGAAVATNRIFYYASGAWIADMYVQGKGEAGLFVALLVGIVSFMVMGMIYIFLFCRLYSWLKQNKG